MLRRRIRFARRSVASELALSVWILPPYSKIALQLIEYNEILNSCIGGTSDCLLRLDPWRLGTTAWWKHSPEMRQNDDPKTGLQAQKHPISSAAGSSRRTFTVVPGAVAKCQRRSHGATRPHQATPSTPARDAAILFGAYGLCTVASLGRSPSAERGLPRAGILHPIHSVAGLGHLLPRRLHD